MAVGRKSREISRSLLTPGDRRVSFESVHQLLGSVGIDFELARRQGKKTRSLIEPTRRPVRIPAARAHRVRGPVPIASPGRCRINHSHDLAAPARSRWAPADRYRRYRVGPHRPKADAWW